MNVPKFCSSILCVLLVVFVSSCGIMSRKLGMRDHEFSIRAKKIIWIQIPGLSINHFAMTKFGESFLDNDLEVEKASCIGKVWNYSLFDLSPSSRDSLMIQLSGRRNIQNTCPVEDFAWSSLKDFGYTSGVYLRSSEVSLDKELKGCFENDSNGTIRWISEPAIASKDSLGKSEKFHSLEKKADYFLDRSYSDKSCNEKNCHSSLRKTVSSIYSDFFEKRDFYFFNILDFSYQSYLKSGQFSKAIQYLSDLNELIGRIRSTGQEHMLIVLSGVEPIDLQIPKKGKSWKELDNKLDKGKASLQSDILAFGASSENFCGLYHSSELKHRLMRGVAPRL